MKKLKVILPFFIILIIGIGIHFSCQDKNSIGTLFGNITKSPLYDDENTARSFEVQKSFQKIFNLYKNKVVFITTEQIVRMRNPYYNHPFFRGWGMDRGRNKQRIQKRKGLGTGFIISADGYICTNSHVIKGVDKVKVKVNDKTYEAKIIGSDERTDLALLKIKTKEPLTPVYFGDSDKVKVGDWAVAIGNPFGLDRTFTVGVVSAIGRTQVDMMGGSHIQTDASINPGNSGGPLINIYGEVVGINRMIYSKSGGYMGIGFAIPVNTAQKILDQLKKYKKVKWGYIGVSIVDLTEEYAKRIGRENTKGAYVGEVIENGPAAKAGLKIGDLIVKVNNKKVKSYKDLMNIVGITPIGKTLKFKVWRNRRFITLFVTVKERPEAWQ